MTLSPWPSAKLCSFAHLHDLLCYWCETEVDLQVPFSHPLSATREHLIPRSLNKGARHQYVLAHRRCNSMRACMSADGFQRLMRGSAVTKFDLWPHEFWNDGAGETAE